MNEPADWTVRRATSDDVDRVFAFLSPFMSSKHILPRTLDDLRQLLGIAFVAEAPEVVGFGAVEIYSKKLAEVQCMAVDPHFQGRGIAKHIVQLCVAEARNQGVRELMAITASERLFQSCGFHYSLPSQRRALFIQTDDLEV